MRIFGNLAYKFPFISLLFLFACTGYYLPVSDGNIQQISDFSVKESDGIVYAVSLKNWYHEPQLISDNYFPVFITVNNQSRKRLDISRNDVIILDENNNQFDSVTNRELIDLIDNSISQDMIVDKYDIGNLEKKSDIIQKNIESKNNILRYSFHFGFIAAGAKKSGFVFFPEIPSKNKKITILIKNQKFTYIKSKK